MPTMARGCIAEFLGTFALVFFGAGAIILTRAVVPGEAAPGSLVTVALAHGLVLGVFVPACMYISGAQFNPAVSIGLLLIGKQPARTAIAYIITQLIAAACAAGMLVFLLGSQLANNDSVRLGATLGSFSMGETANLRGLFGLELIMTFALMFIILTAVVDKRAHKVAGVAVGMTVAMCIVAFGPLTGASMNPARTFGPAIYGHFGDHHWVYWVATILGACLAALTYRAVWQPTEDTQA
ncbi:MAG: aquaporin [Phycisphaeraceae bacterium]|nr:aquaporin [Phycisphaeraceae bacterium]